MAPDALSKANTLSGLFYRDIYSNDVAARLGIGRFVQEMAQIAERNLKSV
jgi:hypothetical protein